MMSNQWFAFIESNTTGTGKQFLTAARKARLCPALLTADPTRYQGFDDSLVKVVTVNTSSESAVFEKCRSMRAAAGGLAGVWSSSEYYIGMAANIARRMNLPGPSPTAVRNCRNKELESLSDAGVLVPSCRGVSSIRGAIAAASQLGWPVIVKPIKGTGSVGVKLCWTEDEVRQHARALLRQRRNERGQGVLRRILVQEYVVGQEYSVETFNTEIVGITRKHLGAAPYFVEVGHDYPAALGKRDLAALAQVSRDALSALGLGWGPAHIELRLTPKGPSIIEVNPRLAGGFIPELVRLATGIDLVSATVRLAAGRPVKLVAKHREYASIRFVLPHSNGTLVGVSGWHEAARGKNIAQAQLYVAKGATIQIRSDFRDRLGHVISVAAKAANAISAVERASAYLDLKIDPSTAGSNGDGQ